MESARKIRTWQADTAIPSPPIWRPWSRLKAYSAAEHFAQAQVAGALRPQTKDPVDTIILRRR